MVCANKSSKRINEYYAICTCMHTLFSVFMFRKQQFIARILYPKHICKCLISLLTMLNYSIYFTMNHL